VTSPAVISRKDALCRFEGSEKSSLVVQTKEKQIPQAKKKAFGMTRHIFSTNSFSTES
jgi:hypothetical protein